MRVDLLTSPWKRGPGSLGMGLWIVAGLLVAGWLALVSLDITAKDLEPGAGGWRLTVRFLGAAFQPALESEAGYSGPPGAILWIALGAAIRTVVFAAAALSLAVVIGFPLGFLGAARTFGGRGVRAVSLVVRFLSNVMRSCHELIWAVLLLAAFGRGHMVAVVAIALPYAGVLAKVFAEMIDEADDRPATALKGAGAGRLQQFTFGLLPMAWPDLLSYTFYRFECALRSSAVLGFFGFPTLGYQIAASFENLHYREVWTYLYVLFVLVAVVDWWSGRIRREVRP